MRDRETVQRIKDATDIVELVGQAVKLRKQGSAWVGLCPFHSERTPSFSVIPDRGYYHCFGCGKNGDVFAWLMEREGMTFREAMEQLAKAAGIELPRFRADGDRAKDELEARMRSALDLAQTYYQDCLAENPRAGDYLSGRGIAPEFARRVGLGFAPDGWENVVGLLRRDGLSPDLIEQTGLAARSSKGNLIDFMRNRLTIPIRDQRGRLVAFGGRAFGDDKPKYLNTRETKLFKKSETLFGLDTAKGQMRDGALLVEGYFDVLMLQQGGINQAVAPLGTALTEDQLKTLARFTKKITLCFDGDEAGRRAAEKSLKVALPLGFDIRLLALPQGEDPDTWCVRIGSDQFRQAVSGAPDWVGFVIDRARDGRDTKKISDRMEVFRAFKELFAFMPRTPENWSLLQSVAADLGIPKHELNRALVGQADYAKQGDRRPRGGANDYPPPVHGIEMDADCDFDVDDLLRPFFVLCCNEDNRRMAQDMPTDWWEHLSGAGEFQTLLDSDGDDAALPPKLLGLLRNLEANWAGKDEIKFESAAHSLEKAYVLREIKISARLIGSPEVLSDPGAKSRLEARLARLIERKNALSSAPTPRH